MRKNITRTILGLIILGIGVGYIGKFAGFWPDFTILFPGWWTMLIILPMAISVINDGPEIFNVTALLVGVALLLSNDAYGIIEFKQIIWIAIGTVLIALGLKIIFAPMIRKRKYKRSIKAEAPDGTYFNDSENKKVINTSFSSHTENFDGRTFDGADASVAFGELTLDLRHAVFTHDTAVKAGASFGQLTILLPENVILKLTGSTSFGATNLKRNNPTETGLPVVIVSATASFGAVTIK